MAREWQESVERVWRDCVDREGLECGESVDSVLRVLGESGESIYFCLSPLPDKICSFHNEHLKMEEL